MIDFKSELNQEQYQAVTHDQGPLLILAGAGSGKTRALTYRAAYLIQDKHIDPGGILLLTFTNKAAGEMQHRLKALIGAHLPFAGTFHSFCAKFLRREGMHDAIGPNFVIYDDQDQIDLIKLILKKLDLPKQFSPRGVLSTIGQAKHELLTPDEYQRIAQGYFQENVAEVYRHYQKRLTQNQAVDFDDLLVKTVHILSQVDEVRQRYQRRFQHVLIDEYQDTNKAQYLIAKLIAQEHHQLTVVGDAAQSIYRWRGADYRNLEYLSNDFPDLTTIRLEQNYRSTQPILDAAYAVISNNRSHPILSLWTDQTAGDRLTLFEAEDEKEEANYVISQLNKAAAREVAVLYRTNAQSRAFEEACIRAGIPYSLVGGVKFYERKEIKDILAYLRLLLNPLDEVSLNRAAKNGKRRLQNLLTLASSIDVANIVTSELFDQVVQSTTYLDKFDARVEADLARLENLKELRSVTLQFDNLVDFLENVALVEQSAQSQSANQEPAVITLMTVHASKGLEFDQVFVAGLEEGIFPHSRSLFDPVELEEERRLCYVALTRARTQLHLSYARNRVYFGTGNRSAVSRFISEIPENLLISQNRYTGNTSLSRRPSEFEDSMLDQFLADEIDIDDFLR